MQQEHSMIQSTAHFESCCKKSESFVNQNFNRILIGLLLHGRGRVSGFAHTVTPSRFCYTLPLVRLVLRFVAG